MLFVFIFRSEIDNDGVIEPDTDEPQEMGDFEIVEVSFWVFCHSHNESDDEQERRTFTRPVLQHQGLIEASLVTDVVP